MPKQSSTSVKAFYRPFSREQLIVKLREALPSLARELTLRRVVLFGSWATGRATAFSDIDLLIVYAGPPRVDADLVVYRILNLRGIEAHVYSEGDAESLRQTIERMTSSGIELLAPSDNG